MLVRDLLRQLQSISLTMLMPLRYQSITGAGADSAALYLLPLAMGLPWAPSPVDA